MAMTLRFTDEQEKKLTALAQQQNVSKQQAISLAVDEAYERNIYNKKLDQAMESVLTRYADALERLGK